MRILLDSHRNGESIVSGILTSDIRDAFLAIDKQVGRYEISDIRKRVIAEQL